MLAAISHGNQGLYRFLRVVSRLGVFGIIYLMESPKILLYYKYIHIERPKDVMIQQRAVCGDLGLTGRILVAQEGINGTVEGSAQAVAKYMDFMDKHPLFGGIKFKQSQGTGSAFSKLKVKVRSEIVTSELGADDVNPNVVTGKYLSAEQLHEWFEQGKNFKIVDMRNEYEHIAGHFEGSVLPAMTNFRDLKKAVENIKDLKEEVVVTVCTGGVRCEKASGYLVTQGFKDVYQLEDGIVSYMEKYPNKHFKGKLYVFDNRMLMAFETDSPEHELVGRCIKCQIPSERFTNCSLIDCHKQIICCENCLEDNKIFCTPQCKETYKQNERVQTQVMAI